MKAKFYRLKINDPFVDEDTEDNIYLKVTPPPKEPDWNEVIQELSKNPSRPKKESRGYADNFEVALVALECVEHLAYSGLTYGHAARYLQSVVKAALAWMVDGETPLPHPLNPHTQPLLDLLIGKRDNGTAKDIRPVGGGSRVPVDGKKRRKPNA